MKVKHRRACSSLLKKQIACTAIAILSLNLGLTAQYASAAPTGKTVLPGHLTPEAVKTLTALGRLSPARTLSLDLVLPLRNTAALEDLLRRQADPTDALYGKYLTPAQFADRFGPAVTDLNAVANYAKTQGLSVTQISGNRTTIGVTGPVSAIETAFGVKMQSYTDRKGNEFYAPDAEPTVPSALAGKLLAVVGLNKVGIPHAFMHRVQPDPSSATALPAEARPLNLLSYSGHQGLAPSDIKSIYNLNGISSQGTGETLGLFELSSYRLKAITTYETYYSLPAVTLQNVGVAGFNTGSTPNGAAAEVTLDIDLLIAGAPSASKIIVYEANGGSTDASFETASLNIFNQIATDDLANVSSVSYGLSEIDVTQAEAQANNQALMQCATQGQTVCAASGDAGAYTDQSNSPNDLPSTSEPGSQPYITGAGGTDLKDSTTSPYQYVSETSWSDTSDSSRGNDGTGGGGGISQYWTIPSYQSGAFSTSVNPQGSTTMRNVPDVALYGDYDTGGYDIYYGGSWGGYNGTSASSPLWAAFIADVDSARASAGSPALGLANTAIYAIAKQPSLYANDFHDVTTGNNLYYNAVAGYDNSTGWGSFNGVNLFNDLVSYGTVAAPTITSFSPSSGAVGSTVIINGTNLNGVTAVRFHDSSATAFSATPDGTLLKVIVPSGAQTGTITVTTPGGSIKTATPYTVLPVPVVTSFTPTSGPVGTVVTVTGKYLNGVTAVRFHNANATTFSANAGGTQLTVTVPTGAGTGTFTVTTPNGSVKTTGTFTVTIPAGAPTVSSFTPTSGPVGTVVTVTGTNLNGVTAVRFHNANATTFSANGAGTQLTVTVPTGAATGTFTVTTPNGSIKTTGTFTVD